MEALGFGTLLQGLPESYYNTVTVCNREKIQVTISHAEKHTLESTGKGPRGAPCPLPMASLTAPRMVSVSNDTSLLRLFAKIKCCMSDNILRGQAGELTEPRGSEFLLGLHHTHG